MHTAIRTILAAAAVAVAVPAHAHASQAFLDNGTQARLVAGGGEYNDVTAEVVNGGTAVKFTDLEDITNTNCQVLNATQVLCQAPAGAKIQSVKVTTGSFDDKIVVHTNNALVRVHVHGGKDADEITVTGSPASDEIYGGLGPDKIVASDANSFVYSGATGAGGDDSDTVDLGDGSNYATGGDDADTIKGGPQKDTTYGEEGNDSITGAAGNDVTYGGIGNDTLTGGTGFDELHGQDGNDKLNMVDGIVDTAAHCGPGANDVATIDQNEMAITKFCESITTAGFVVSPAT